MAIRCGRNGSRRLRSEHRLADLEFHGIRGSAALRQHALRPLCSVMWRLKVSSPNSDWLEYEFEAGCITIGREEDNLIVLEDLKVSRHHAELAMDDGEWRLRDLHSTRGLFVRGNRITECVIKDGDTFTIADFEFVFLGRSMVPPTVQSETAPRDTPIALESPPESAEPSAPKGPRPVLSVQTAVTSASSRSDPAVVLSVAERQQVREASPENAAARPSGHEGKRSNIKLIVGVAFAVSVLAFLVMGRFGSREKPDVPSKGSYPPRPAAHDEKVTTAPVPLPKAPSSPPNVPPQPLPAPVVTTPKADMEPPDDPEQPAVVYQRVPEGSMSAPVFSADLRHVLHYLRGPKGQPEGTEIYLDRKLIRKVKRVDGEGDLQFAADNVHWLVHATDEDGTEVLILPDRTWKLEGQLQSLRGSFDFSTLAFVERKDDEDRFFVNQKIVATYPHIQDIRLGKDGDHWAYVAVKELTPDPVGKSPGERVVTDQNSGPIFDRIEHLALSEDGRHVGYVGLHHNAEHQVIVDAKVAGRHMVEKEQVVSLAVSPVGGRLAYATQSPEGITTFNIDGLSPTRIDLNISPEDPEPQLSMLAQKKSMAAIVFSSDGRHVAFAASGRRGVVYSDANLVGVYPAVQVESLTFSPDGTKLAFITLHPLGSVSATADGAEVQPHAAILHINEKTIETVPTLVRRSPAGSLIHLGGFSKVSFAADSIKLAYQQFAYEANRGLIAPMLHVNGRTVGNEAKTINDFAWSSADSMFALFADDESGDKVSRVLLKVGDR